MQFLHKYILKIDNVSRFACHRSSGAKSLYPRFNAAQEHCQSLNYAKTVDASNRNAYFMEITCEFNKL